MKKYDVIVLGGGFAGVAAAIASAREGAKTLLVEKGNALGGAAVNCLVNPFMPYSTKIDGVLTELSQGIFTEINKRLEAKNAIVNRHFLEEELKFVLNDMVLEAGVELLFHAYLYAASKENGKIKSISVATKCGPVELEANTFVDASGDAQLAYLAGCPTVLGREPDHLCQPMTLCFRVGNVDREKFLAGRPAFQMAYAEAKKAGTIKNPREDVLVFKFLVPNVLHFNTTRIVKKNPTDPFDVTAAEIEARRQVEEIYQWLKQNANGLENSFLMSTASEIGVRESRMIVGDYVLTESDCRAFTKFEDGIAACNYDIDIHNPEGSGTSHYYFPEGEFYTIPYRSLIPKEAENLLVAGRCISSDHCAQASYRIMPTVCSLGEAAGVAAGMACRAGIGVREINVEALKENLKRYGAFLGI